MLSRAKDKVNEVGIEGVLKILTPLMATMGISEQQGQKIIKVIDQIDATQQRTENIENMLITLCKKNNIVVREDAPQVPTK